MKNTIKYWRQEKRLTQIELSKVSGVPKYLIQLNEIGTSRLTQKEVHAIAKALGLSEEQYLSLLESEQGDASNKTDGSTPSGGAK